MTESKRKKLEAKLKKMIEQLDQSEVKRMEPTARFRNGNIIFIRRRKGERDRRFDI